MTPLQWFLLGAFCGAMAAAFVTVALDIRE